MPRRGDNIRKRKDGRWEARYAINAVDAPFKKYGSVYGKTYREAKEKREKIVKQGSVPNGNGDLAFKDLLNAWQNSNHIRLKESSVSRYQNLIDAHILPTLGNLKVSRINATVINRFLAAKLKNGRLDGSGGLSAAYVRSIALILHSAIRYAISENLCAPLNSAIEKPSPQKAEITVLPLSCQRSFEETLLKNMGCMELLIYITLYTGLRIGEACALRWEDINLESGVISVRQTVSRVWHFENNGKRSEWIIGPPKTTSSFRSIPLCSKVYEVIRNFPQKQDSGYVLSDFHNGSFISPRTFEYRYKKIVQACGLTPINFHALRHTFATRCIESGVDIKSLSEMLGHADASITLKTYVHSSMELKRNQIEKLIS